MVKILEGTRNRFRTAGRFDSKFFFADRPLKITNVLAITQLGFIQNRKPRSYFSLAYSG